MKSIMQILRLAFLALLAAVLPSCGGGGDGTSNSGNATPQTATAETKVVSIGAGIPTATMQRLNVVVTPTSQSTSGSSLSVNAISGTRPDLVLAASDTTPYLAAFADTDSSLSADSTATALSRIGLGFPYPIEITAARLTAAIKSAPSYQLLVTAINNSLQVGAPPTEDDKVLDSVFKVITETKASLSATPTAKVSAESIKTLPYDFFNYGVTDRVWLTNAPGSDLTFNNRTAIFWKVSASPLSGSTDVYVEPRELTALQLIGGYAGSEKTQVIHGADPQFTVSISQDATTRKENNTYLVRGLTLLILDIVYQVNPNIGDKCSKFVATRFINEKLPGLLADPSPSAALDYIQKTFGLSNIPSLGAFYFDLVKDCYSENLVNNSVGQFLKILPDKVKTYLAFIKALKVTRQAFTTIDTAIQGVKYVDYKQSVDACKLEGSIVPCEFSMKIEPIAPILALGSKTAFKYKFVNANGNELKTPLGVIWRSNDPTIATVDPDTGMVTAIKLGTTRIYAVDRNTLTEGSAEVIISSRYSGPYNITGVLTMLKFPCTGTVNVSGTMTVDVTAGASSAKLAITETESGCFSLTGTYDHVIALTQSGNKLTGANRRVYDCLAECTTGIIDYALDLVISGEGENSKISGTLQYVGSNSGASISAKGPISLDFQRSSQ